jgi:HD-like signal output (HDOD) protein
VLGGVFRYFSRIFAAILGGRADPTPEPKSLAPPIPKPAAASKIAPRPTPKPAATPKAAPLPRPAPKPAAAPGLHAPTSWESQPVYDLTAEDSPAPSLLDDDGPDLLDEDLFAWDPAPWEKGGVPKSIELDSLRNATLMDLAAMEQQGAGPGERKFIGRLAKAVSARGLKLPPFPDIARKLETLLSSSEVNAFKISQLVEKDPALVRAVWVRATSVQFSRPPGGLKGAIARIGNDDLWRIATRVALESSVFKVAGMQDLVEEIRLHSFAVAEVTAWMAGEKRGPNYLAGLLHDVGKFVVFRCAVSSRKTPDPHPDFVTDVVERFHPSLSALVAHAWQLGPMATAGMGFHHNPKKAPKEHRRAAFYIYLADIVAHGAAAERQGMPSKAREVLGNLKGIKFDADKAMDRAHDAFNDFEKMIAVDSEMD